MKNEFHIYKVYKNLWKLL